MNLVSIARQTAIGIVLGLFSAFLVVVMMNLEGVISVLL
jgi:hypothetical protein